MSFYTGKTPTKCQTTRGIILPMKSAGKYRIIHVGSALTALLDSIATRRLNYILEKNDLIAHQSGFVAKKSRHDLVARLIELSAKYKAQMGPKARTTIINLDIMGAFDNVDQGTLIEKILTELSTDEPNTDIRNWLTNYILERYIQIEYNQTKTSITKVYKGVPQGSALGPALWNFYINHIDNNLHQKSKVEKLKYADDLLMVFNGGDNSTPELQKAPNQLIHNLGLLKLEIVPSKCTLMSITNQPTEIKFLSLRQGLEVIEPKWERIEIVIENGLNCLLDYPNSLLRHHKRQFQNIMLKFKEIRQFYMTNIKTK